GRRRALLLHLGAQVPLVFLLPTAVIGILVGSIAGSTGRPLRGALLGAVLSGVVFELFMLPCASVIGTFGSITGDRDAGGKFLRETLLYGLEMAVAGALAGGLGVLVGK